MISKRAENYGKSFFDVESSESVLKSLRTLSEVLKEPVFAEFFNSLVIPLKEKKEVLQKVMGKNNVNLQNFLFLLLDRQACSLLPEIVQTYENLLDEKNSRVRGVIYSFEEMSSQKKKEIEKALEKILKKKVDLVARKDTSLMGGLYIKVGDYIFNDTLECHLRKFQSSGG